MALKGKLSGAVSFKASNLLVFLLIISVHICFKALYLNNSGLWYDEVVQLFYSQQDWGLIKHTAEWNRNAPLYYYFLYIWRNLFGNGEVALRMSSVIFSSLAAGILFMMIRKHFGKLAALISLILFTFSNEIYFYSQETSVHSLIVFLAVSSFYFFLNLIDRRNVFSLVMLGICNFLLVYGQYITVIIPLLQLLSVLLLYKKEIFKRTGLSFAITVLLAVWRFTYKNVHFILFPDKNSAPKSPDPGYLEQITYTLFNGQIFFFVFAGVLLFCVVYLVFTKQFIYPEKNKNIKLASVFLTGAAGIPVCYVLYFLMTGFGTDQFVFLIPLLFSLIGIMVSRLDGEIKYAIAGATIFLSLIFYLKMKTDVKKPMDYRTAMHTIKQLKKREKDMIVLVETRDIGFLFAYYYDRKIFEDFQGMEDRLKEQNIFLVSTKDDLEALGLERFDKILLVQTFDELNPGDKGIMKRIGQQTTRYVNYWSYARVHITVHFCTN
ncbi:MAG: glycosyltransferase family 39 protein [Bacteroidia bacterium]